MNFKTKFARIVPPFSRSRLIIVTVLHFLFFELAKLIAGKMTLHCFEIPFDAMIPFFAPFITVYVLAFPFWIVNIILIMRESPSFCKSRFLSLLLIEVVSFLFFALYPTTMTRAEITGTDIFSKFTVFIYQIDTPLNLFPSLHCSISWFCFRGLFGGSTSKSYRVFSCIFAILICASTLLVKQHVFLDTISGLVLAEMSLWIFVPSKMLVSQRKNR